MVMNNNSKMKVPKIIAILLTTSFLLHECCGFGIPVPDWIENILVESQEALHPWIGTTMFIFNFIPLWITCDYQAYYFYSEFGGDAIFERCMQTIFDNYKTVFKTEIENAKVQLFD